MPTDPSTPAIRTSHVGYWLRLALERFDARVLVLMAQHPGVPLGLANLAGRQQIGAAHVHITRHLARGGARLTTLAQAAGMSKQAMGTLVDQCAAWGMVTREDDPLDARAKRVVFTATGLPPGLSIDPVTGINDSLFGFRSMDEQDIRFAFCTHFKRLACADSDCFNMCIVLLLELRDEDIKQAAVQIGRAHV